MRALVIASDIGQQAASELFERVKIPHIQGCHPLIFQGTEPSLDLGLLCGSIRAAVADHRSDPGSQQFHLPVFVGRSVIKVKNLGLAVLGDGRLHDGHKIHESIMKEDICPQDKPAGIVDQGNHINAALSAVRSLQPGTGTGIAAPYFINMRPLVTAHILIVRQTLLEDELVDETADRRF